MSRVVVVVFNAGQVRKVNAYVEAAVGAGAEVTVLSASGGQGWGPGRDLHPAARAVTVGPAEHRQPLVWLYLAFVEKGPGVLLRRAAGRLPGPAGRACGKGAALHAKAARTIRRRLFWPAYKVVRGQALRRLALRRLGDLGLDGAERVVVVDEAAVPFGWALARRRPGLDVTRRLDRTLYDPPAPAP
ncbi:hypothetical protein [Glycomyces paridis]|uniref:Glycosyltransferase family 4 protein n=1 Tax=Glycomyces paridis TaxID=2126555 RepID=A0A4S8PQD9_9ACTN|nr:hypothetical protein [Glycomyces paridis]THV31985.1 hypothetical protein E9998_00565 [Glycomyces paridis]